MKISEETYVGEDGLKHNKIVYGMDENTITSVVETTEEIDLTEEYTDELLDD